MSIDRKGLANSRRCTRPSGVTLVELLVSVVVGLLLTAGAIQLFINSRENYEFQEELARIQETGRFGIDMLNSELRSGDLRGCAGRSLERTQVQNLLDNGNPSGAQYFGQSVTGFTHDGSNWDPTLPTELTTASPAPDPDSDVLRIRTALGGTSVRVTAHDRANKDLEVDDATGIEVEDILLVSDCNSAAVFQVAPGGGDPADDKLHYGSGGSIDPGNRNTQMLQKSGRGEVTSWTQHAYYVAAGESGEPTLFRLREGSSSAEELVSGVERIALEFGENTDSDPDVEVYRAAENVSDWANVAAVRIHLLIRSQQDNVVDNPQAVAFPRGTTAQTFGDKRLRQVFSTNVSLRNRAQ